jgi:predicted heme/steroid binding protein
MTHHHLNQPIHLRRSRVVWGLVLLPWLVAGGLALATPRVTAEPLRQLRPAKTFKATPTPVPHNVAAAELSAHDGLDGRTCYVAVSGTVYLMPPSADWKDGQYVTSNGQASCGRDLTAVLGSSPHGAAVLHAKTVVGPLVP